MKIKLTSELYDTLKKIALIYLPALATLYATVALIWGIPAITQILATLSAIDTFFGVVLHLSSTSYVSDNPHDGTMHVTTNADGTQVAEMDLSDKPEALVTQPTVTFRVQHHNPDVLPSGPVS